MLNGIARCITPELIAHLMRMGHGDEIALVDVDFPAYTCGGLVIRADGVGMLTLLNGILPLFPLDTFVDNPAAMMAPAGNQRIIDNWKTYADRITENMSSFNGFEFLERYAFYERVKSCYGIVVTGEPDGNIILKKGVVSNIL
jgi:L-fucose mutarotase